MSIFLIEKITRRYDDYKEINQVIDDIELLKKSSVTGDKFYDFPKIQSLRKQIKKCYEEYIPNNIRKVQYEMNNVPSKDKKVIVKELNNMKGYFELYDYQLNALNEQARKQHNDKGVRHKHMKQNERTVKNWLF